MLNQTTRRLPVASVSTAWVPFTRRPQRISDTANTVPMTVCGVFAGSSWAIFRRSEKSLKRRGKRNTASEAVATPSFSSFSAADLPMPGRWETGESGRREPTARSCAAGSRTATEVTSRREPAGSAPAVDRSIFALRVAAARAPPPRDGPGRVTGVLRVGVATIAGVNARIVLCTHSRRASSSSDR